MAKDQLGTLVAQGRTADIHAWKDDQTVVKLYHNWFPLKAIQQEAARVRAVQGVGLPVPQVGQVVQVNGRNGLIFERIDGTNMLEMILQNPSLNASLAGRLADLHYQLHKRDVQLDIPRQRQRLIHAIQRADPLSDALKTTLLNRLHQLPDGHSICHGDFHPGNIIICPQAESREVIVDWNDCTFGNPLADVARSTILFLGGITGNENPNPAFEQLVRDCHQQYLNRYFELSRRSQAEYEQWLPIMAGARLSENITALEPWLLLEAEKVNA